MRFPVNNWATEWNGTAGYGFGAETTYGRHDGVDINDNGGGNSDLGKPLYAIAKGTVVGIHKHTGSGNFGNHFFMKIDGEWGTRYVHYTHCLELFVTENQEVEEGYQVAKVGNSGTTYAHCHFAIKKKPSGMDDVANTKAELDDIWEDPIAFIERYLSPVLTPQPPLPQSPMNDQTHIPLNMVTVLEEYKEPELQQVRSFIKSKDQAIKDLTEGNNQQSDIIGQLHKDLDKLKVDFAKYISEQKQAHDTVKTIEETTTTFPSAGSTVTVKTSPKTSSNDVPDQFTTFLSTIRKWLGL